jgi:hypothetical protein
MEQRKFLALPGPIYLASILISSSKVWVGNQLGDSQEYLEAEGRIMLR